MLNQGWISSFSNTSLALILFITEKCNFRCLYCYEDFKHGRMESDIILGVKRLINRRIASLDLLEISFFGGEPLLNKPAIIEISSWANKLCEKHEVEFVSGITTNGYLLDKNIFHDFLVNNITDFQITIDGVSNVHDKLRHTVNGNPTFDIIYDNLKMMAKFDSPFTCTIRFNIADSNFESIKEFISDYSSPFANDRRFSFHFHPVFGDSELKLSKDKQLDELIDLADIKNFKYNYPTKDQLCYAGRADSFVIRANGKIQKCTVSLDNELNNLGYINRDGDLNIDSKKFKKWVLSTSKGCPLMSLSVNN